jgi:hypothetical protein
MSLQIIASEAPLKVSEKWGFRENQRVIAQDVAPWPPQHYNGTIVYVWSDGTAIVKFDYNLPFATERRLVQSDRVELHHLSRIVPS